MAYPAIQSPLSPTRPRTAQPLTLPQPFASSIRAGFKEPTPRPSLNDILLSSFQGLSSKEEKRIRGKEENRLKRTFEGVVTNVEKMARRFKSIPGGRLPENMSMESVVVTMGAGSAADDVHNRKLHQNSLSPFRSASRNARERKRTRVEKVQNDRTVFNTNIFESRLGLKRGKKLDLPNGSRPSTSLEYPLAIVSSPVLLVPEDFPASAGAGARAAVATFKSMQSPPLSPRTSSQSIHHDSPIDGAIEFIPCEKTRDDSLYDLDRMEIDGHERSPARNTTHKYPDPLSRFPLEVVEIIFANLEPSTLTLLRTVSRGWKAVAESNHVWRQVFLRQYGTLPGPEPYLKIGGRGIGNPSRTQQNFRAMATARRKLDQSWRSRQPKATYFCGHTDSVYCCQFDESKIITGSRDRTIRVWDMKDMRCLRVIGAPANIPRAPSPTTPDLETHKNTVCTVQSVNGTREGLSIYHSPAYFHHASILCLQYDDEIMVTGSSDTTCIVWDIKTFEPITCLRRHQAGVLDICFDDRFIISCSKDFTICVWSRETYELLNILEGHGGPVNAVQMRGNMLVSASGDGNSKLWDLTTMKAIRTFRSQDRGLAAVEFSDDGRYVLAGGNDQVIYKYDANTCRLLHKYEGHNNLVRSLFLDYANNRVLSGSYDQGMRVYNFETGEEIAIYNNWTTSWILSAKCDYRRICATSQDGRVLLMDFGHDIPDVELLAHRPPLPPSLIRNTQALQPTS